MLKYLGRLSPLTHWVILLVGCGIFFFLWLQHVPLTEIDEARFTEATREMVTGGDYIIPHFNWEPRYRKPVLIYWLQAGMMKLFGQNETAARIPSGLAVMLIIFMTYRLLLSQLTAASKNGKADSRSEARGAALFAAAMLIMIPLTAVWSRAAVADGVLTFWITASLLSLLKADFAAAAASGKKTALVRNWYWIASVCAGMAFLTKGPIGLAIPFLAWLIYHIRQKDLKDAARQMPWVSGIGLFVLVAVPWYAATYIVDGPDFLRWFFLRENLERYTSTMHGWGGMIPFCYMWYPVVSVLLAFPLSAFLVHDLIKPFAGNSGMAAHDNLSRLRRFSWCWILTVIGIFSLSKTQFPHYIHSIIGAVGILFGLHIYARFAKHSETTEPSNRKARTVETTLLVLLSVGLIGYLIRALSIGHGKPGRIAEWPYPEPAATDLMFLLGFALLVFVFGVWRLNRKGSEEHGMLVIGSAWAVVMAALILGVAPFYVRSVYSPTAAMGGFLKSIARDEPIITYLREAPEGLVYYSQHRIEFFARKHGDAEPLKQVTGLIKKSPSSVVITDASGLKELAGLGKMSLLKTIDKTMAVRIVRK